MRDARADPQIGDPGLDGSRIDCGPMPDAPRIPFISRLLAGCIALAVLALFASNAPAFYEPDGFRGITWGMSVSDAERTLKSLYAKHLLVGNEPTCETARGGQGIADSAMCTAAMQMDSIRIGLSFEFYEDRFVAVTVVATAASYGELKSSFIARYGAPTRAEKRTKPGPFSEYTSEELRWDGPTVRIKLSQYVGDLTFTVGVIALRSEWDRQAAEQERSTAPPPQAQE